MLGWLALIVAVLAGLLVFFQYDTAALDGVSAWIIAGGVLALLIGLYIATLRGQWRETVGNRKLGWFIVSAAVVGAAIWTFKEHPVLRTALQTIGQRDAELAQQAIPGPISVMIRRNSAGQFSAQGQINDASASLLIDTGASVVMLKTTDAEAAGLDVKSLSFTTPIQTANGTVYAAPVRVRSISVGLLRLTDVEALVAKPGSLNENLLGMSFLRRLSSYQLTGEFITLRQ